MTPGQRRDMAKFLSRQKVTSTPLHVNNTEEIIKATNDRLNNWRKAGYNEGEIRKLNNDWIDYKNQSDERFND